MTKIQWTDESWNPIIGCEPISPGCKNCYAEKMAFRLLHMPKTSYYMHVVKDNGKVLEDFRYIKEWNGKTHFAESQLEKPFKWKKPRMIFVCSMGDLFHESVPFEWIDKVWFVIAQNPQHTFQILTKRPERMKDYFIHMGREAQQNDEECIAGKWLNPLKYFDVLPNLWLGVTTENQEQANKRIPILCQIPAAKRFISCEPLLSDIDLQYPEEHFPDGPQMCCSGSECGCLGLPTEPPVINHLDWVIAGPETGHKARPMKKEWIRNIYSQCKAAKVPFFDKKNTLGLDLTQIPE
jgi:protein gp37